MEPATLRRFAETLRAEHASAPRGASEAPFVVSAAVYRDAERCARERRLVERTPRIVAASSEIAPGTAIAIDIPGTSAIVSRTPDGTLRAFANACRHRGTRLVDTPCTKAIVCPYHAWTYDLDGRLVHVPHRETFGALPLADRGLVALPVSERAGLVWLGDAAAHAEPIAPDLDALGLARHVVWRRARVERRCNWKLVVEAFLDGYHIRVLHRDSVYQFFLDAAFVAERAGPHMRAMTARRALVEAPGLDALGAPELRQLGTPSFFVAPATTIVVHPDFVSVIVVDPVAPDRTTWEHVMLIPAERAGETEHWTRSWALIEDRVFQREDLWVCEQIQRSIDAGATNELVFGSLETPVRWFHEALARALAEVT
ncbi:MAG TPA: aromatic ring-hydroxylating dioxygenase subunit alpha [Kofleriaceae bacterium]|nr:aromatic ring-hydroxylating dioxygenase subunit alpha [Kofleriaceae bacterium]